MKRFVSSIQAVFFDECNTRYVHPDLLVLLIASGAEVYGGVHGAMPVVGRDHRYDGIFASALMRMPLNIRLEMMELKLDVEPLGWPRIFCIKKLTMRVFLER